MNEMILHSFAGRWGQFHRIKRRCFGSTIFRVFGRRIKMDYSFLAVLFAAHDHGFVE